MNGILLTLVFVLGEICVAYAQFPFLMSQDTQTTIQCISNYDCSIHAISNATMVALGLHCNPATSRCELSDGTVVGPNFRLSCSLLNITMSAIVYPAYGMSIGSTPHLSDGIIVINMAFPQGLVDYQGTLRLYKIPPMSSPIRTEIENVGFEAYYSSLTGDNPYLVDDVSVNYPETSFTFRTLSTTFLNIGPAPTASYAAAYIDSSGCLALTPGSGIKLSVLTGRANPFPTTESTMFGTRYPNAQSTRESFISLPNFEAYVNTSQKIATYTALPAWLFHREPFNIGFRCVFGQIYDMSGRVISSKVNEELSLSYGDIGGGLRFPDYSRTTPSQPNRPESISKLAGLVKLQLGVGYCFNQNVTDASTNITTKRRHIIADSLGVYEGHLAQSIILDLTQITRDTPAFPVSEIGILPNGTRFNVPLGLYAQFNKSSMYYRLNDVMSNTYLFPLTSSLRNPFGPAFPAFTPVDFTRVPSINISKSDGNFPSNSMCSDDGLSVIFYDYSDLGMQGRYPTEAPSLFLYRVNTSDPLMQMTLVDSRAPFMLPGSFSVDAPGMYCMDVWADLADGLGYRVFLRSCFQVGTLGVSVTQLTSSFEASPVDPFPETSLPFYGYGSYAFTSIYMGLPPILVLPVGLSARVRFLRYLSTRNGSSSEDEGDFSVFELSHRYNILRAGESFVVYSVNRSNFNRFNYDRVAYNQNEYAVSDVLIVRLEIYRPEQSLVYYQCPVFVAFQYMVSLVIQNRIEVGESFCPATLVDVRTYTRGGACMSIDNAFLAALQGNVGPQKEPCTYFQSYFNIRDPENPLLLYATQNAFQYAAPPNTPLRLISYDIAGVIGQTDFSVTSLISEDSTRIVFDTPVPACDTSGVQRVVYSFHLTGSINVVMGNVTIPAIAGWEPLNVLASAAYDPNSPFFDIPSTCLLLATMSDRDVFLMCNSANTTTSPACTNCTKLPVVYDFTDGNSLFVGPESVVRWWNVYAWVPTIYTSSATGRRVYCRFSSSLYTSIPTPMFMIVTNERRVQREGKTCVGKVDCLAIDIQIFIDPVFVDSYPLSGVQLSSSPVFGALRNATALPPFPITNISYIVSIDQIYTFSLSYNDIFCTVSQTQRISAAGQVVSLVRTTVSDCNSPSASAVIFISYVDQSLPTGSLVEQCMFWVGYQFMGAGPFFTYQMAANSNSPLMLPYSPAFSNSSRFLGVGAGLNRIVFYDRCDKDEACTAPLPDCTDLIDQTTLVVDGNRQSLFHEFTVQQFSANSGGIEIRIVDSEPAACYGDTYYYTFDVFDDKAIDTSGDVQSQYGPYQAIIQEPVTGAVIYQTSPQCIFDANSQIWMGGIPLEVSGNPSVLQEDGFKVKLFRLRTFIRTGNSFGFRPSGNFSFVVRNCATGCMRSYVIDIDMVNPFVITLSSSSAQCSGGPLGFGSIVKSISGGTPFRAGELANSPFYYADYDTTLHYAEYITCWKTPLNPTTFECFNLGSKNVPGRYDLRLTDRNGCNASASVIVEGPPPFEVSIVGVDATCSTSTPSTITYEVTQPGNGPPYYTGQALTNVSIGTNITQEFVNSFGNTLCMTILDSKFCRYQTDLCAVIPLPANIIVATQHTDSCPNSNTGTASVVQINGNTDLTGYTCSWQNSAASAVVSSSATSSCSQIAIPANSRLTVEVNSIIGCKGMANVHVQSRPPITITEISRSTTGALNQRPCVERIEFRITGGLGTLNFSISLLGDTTAANVTHRMGSANVTGACRSVQYMLAVKDSDLQCTQTFISKDPFLGFGDFEQNDDDELPFGLPAVEEPSGGDFSFYQIYAQEGLQEKDTDQEFVIYMTPIWLFLSLVLFLVAAAIFFMYRSNKNIKKKKEFNK